MSLPEFAYLHHDRDQLLNTLARFDNGVKVEDVVGAEKESLHLKKHSNTIFIQVLLEFICHAFVKDENQRERLLLEACNRLSKFKIMNDHLIMDKSNELRVAMRRAVATFLKQVCEEVIPVKELDSNALHLLENNLVSTDFTLYYWKNFIELHKIAEGGFGAVFKAKYKLNKLIYAVKKIPFDFKTDANFLMVMREANNIATLHHPNIVRYYSAWIEVADSAINKSDNKSSISDNGTKFKNCTTQECSGIVIKEVLSSENSNSFRVNNSNMDTDKSLQRIDSDFVVFSESAETSSSVNWIVENDSQTFSDYSVNSKNFSDEESDSDDSSPSNFKIGGVLYIQMEYCDCDLHFWLEKRVEGKELPFKMDVTEIFKNILNGVAYIHSRNIIHRDLKPHNIFYSQSSNSLKIGDFGLATLSGFNVNSSHHATYYHSSAIGTVPYAAPEQLKSKNYDMKVDIYSIGVILVELMNVCSTRSELFHVLDAVKNGNFEEQMRKYPVLGNLAQNLISENPEKRMSVKEILNIVDKDPKVLLEEKEELLQKCVITVNEHNEVINNLRKNAFEQNLEVSRLEKLLNEREEENKKNSEKLRNHISNMHKTISEQSTEISRLKKLLNEREEENKKNSEKLRNHISNVHKTISEQSTEISKLNKEYEEFTTEIARLNKIISKLNIDID